MHRIQRELLLGGACTAGTPGAATRARGMRPHYSTASAALLHQCTPHKACWVALQSPCAETSGVGSARRHSQAGLRDCYSCHTVILRGLLQLSHGHLEGTATAVTRSSRGDCYTCHTVILRGLVEQSITCTCLRKAVDHQQCTKLNCESHQANMFQT